MPFDQTNILPAIDRVIHAACPMPQLVEGTNTQLASTISGCTLTLSCHVGGILYTGQASFLFADLVQLSYAGFVSVVQMKFQQACDLLAQSMLSDIAPGSAGSSGAAPGLPLYDTVLRGNITIDGSQRCDLTGPLTIPSGVKLTVNGALDIASDTYLKV